MRRSIIRQATKVGLIGFPEDRNSSFLRGCAAAPSSIRQQFHSPAFNYYCEREMDLAPLIFDYGDIPISPQSDQASLFSHAFPFINRIIQAGHAPLVLGGDHSVSYSIVRSICVGLNLSAVNIVHFDAHPDIYDALDGNRDSHACQFARLCEEKRVQSMVSIGVRTVSSHQREQLNRFGVQTIPAKDFPAKGSDIGLFLSRHLSPSVPIYLSFDMDVIEPGLAPGVSHREGGGLTVRQCIDAIHAVRGKVVGCDLVELNPSRDIDGLSSSVAAKIMKELASRLLMHQEEEDGC